MSDQDQGAAPRDIAFALVVDLGDERAGGIEHGQAAGLRLLLDAPGDAMGTEDGHRLGRHFRQVLDEDRALLLQAFDHVFVVNDLVADIDRRAILLQRAFDDFDRAHNARAKAARLGKKHLHRSSVTQIAPTHSLTWPRRTANAVLQCPHHRSASLHCPNHASGAWIPGICAKKGSWQRWVSSWVAGGELGNIVLISGPATVRLPHLFVTLSPTPRSIPAIAWPLPGFPAFLASRPAKSNQNNIRSAPELRYRAGVFGHAPEIRKKRSADKYCRLRC